MSRNIAPDLEARLKSLYSLRYVRAKLQAEEGVLGVEEEALYGDIVARICQKISEIKTKFPHRVSNCHLFSYIQKDGKFDEEWAQKFLQNFYKLFIDRQFCENGIEKPHLQFNKSKITDLHSKGADLCYAECYAMGFLTMLCEVEKQFEKDAIEKKPTEILPQHFMEMLIEFNKIVTGSQNNLAHSWIRFGATATYPHIKRQKAAQDKFGSNNTLYNFLDSSFVTLLYENYRHKESAIEHYEKYLKATASSSDKTIEAFELAALIPTVAHFCADGNARSANLLGWMMAILHDCDFPITVDPYFVEESLIAEGKSWVREFMRDPQEIASIPTRAFRQHEKLMQDNTLSLEVDDMLAVFLCDLFSKSFEDAEAFFEIPFDFIGDFKAGTSAKFKDRIIISQRQERDFEASEEFNFSEIHRVVTQNHSDIIKAESLDERNQKIAFYFLKQALQMPEIFGSIKNRNLVEKVAGACFYCDLSDKKEFKAVLENCCQKLEEISMSEMPDSSAIASESRPMILKSEELKK